MRISGLLGPLGVYVTVNQLAATRAGRKIAGAGFTIIGITVWVLPAAVSTTAHPGITSLWVILGGALCMGGIALRFGPDRAIQAPYFDEAGIASTPSSPRRKGLFIRAGRGQLRSHAATIKLHADSSCLNSAITTPTSQDLRRRDGDRVLQRYLRDIEKLTRCSLRAVPVPSATPAPRNGPIERPAASNLRRDTRRGLPAPTFGAENRPLPVRFRHSCDARRQPNLVRQVAAANSEAAPLPLGLMARAKRLQQGTRDMLIAREGEKIVCPKGTVCGHITRDANDQIIDGDFVAREFSSSPAEQRYVCACCGRPVAVREPVRWRVHLRRGWVR